MPSPPASSSIASSTSTWADSTMIAVPGSSARITRAACSPSVACPGGILMSMIASSGRAERTWVSSSTPLPAWPTTSNPERSSKLARPSRSRTSSSARTTRGSLRSADDSAISGGVATPPIIDHRYRSAAGLPSRTRMPGCVISLPPGATGHVGRPDNPRREGKDRHGRGKHASELGSVHVSTSLVRWFSAGQGQPGGADVLAAVPGGHGGMPLARERGQQRRRLVTRDADREVHVLQRPLQRELRGIITAVHLVELGVGDRRVQRTALDDLGQLLVTDAEPVSELHGLGHTLDEDGHVGVDDQLHDAALAGLAQPHGLAPEDVEHRVHPLSRRGWSRRQDEQLALFGRSL